MWREKRRKVQQAATGECACQFSRRRNLDTLLAGPRPPVNSGSSVRPTLPVKAAYPSLGKPGRFSFGAGLRPAPKPPSYGLSPPTAKPSGSPDDEAVFARGVTDVPRSSGAGPGCRVRASLDGAEGGRLAMRAMPGAVARSTLGGSLTRRSVPGRSAASRRDRAEWGRGPSRLGALDRVDLGQVLRDAGPPIARVAARPELAARRPELDPDGLPASALFA